MRSFQTMSPDERRASVPTERPQWADVDRLHWADAKAQFNLAILDAPDPPRTLWREIVRKITCPVLLVTADPERGGIVTPAAAEEAAQLWRTGRIVQIADAGHNIRRDQYEPFRTAVTAFLKETA